MTRSRWITLLTGFCALWFVLPSCITYRLWRDAEPQESTQRLRAVPSGAWFASDGTDALVIEIPAEVVEQIAATTNFLPKDAVGMVLTSPGLQARLRKIRTSAVIFVEKDIDGQLAIEARGLWPSPELQALHVLPPRGETLDREVQLFFVQTTAAGRTEWLRVVVTPFTVAIDIVTFPVQLLLFVLAVTVSTMGGG